MSQSCSDCGIVTRGGACSEFNSRRRRMQELARCPNADEEQREYARDWLRRDMGWSD